MSKTVTPAQVGRLQGEISLAKESMQDRHALWTSILDEFCMRNYNSMFSAFAPMADNAQMSDFMSANGRVPYINLYVRKMLGMVASRNNEYLLDPRRPDQEVIASVLEFAFDGVVGKIGLEDKMIEVCQWALLLGTGIGKVGFASELVYGEEAWSDRIVGKDDLPEESADSPYRASTERSPEIMQGNPTLRPVPTFDYFKDPGSRNDEELRREYVRYRRQLMDVRMDVRYKASARANVNGFKIPDNEYLGDDWNIDISANQDDTLYCYVWEVVDIPSGMWCVIPEDGDEALIDWTPLRLPSGMKSPYVKCRLIESVASFWGISYAALMLPSAMSLNIAKAQTLNQIARDGKKVLLYNPNASDSADTFRSQLQRAKNMEPVPMNGLGEQPGTPYAVLDYGGVNPELVRLTTMYSNDLSVISQLTDQTRNMASGEQTATEANIRNSQQQISVSDLRASFHNFHLEVASAICRIMLKEWPQSKLIKVMGADPRVFFWLELDKDKVSEDFDIKIVMGTSEQSDRVLMRRQLAELTPQLMQIGDRIAMQQQMQAQNPNAITPINWEGMMELLLDQYDPKFKNKILRRKDPMQIVMDLVQTKGMQNIQMSPLLMQQVQAVMGVANMGTAMAQQDAQGGFTPEDNGTINNNGGMPFAKSGTPQYAGMPMADSQAFQTGRAASEAQQ